MRLTDEACRDPRKSAGASSPACFEIWPHRSLGSNGTKALLVFVAVAGFFVFVRSPAVHVLPLAIGPLLAVGALALALWCNNRAAARSRETVEIGPEVVTITRRDGKRGTSQMQFATGWVRVAVSHDRAITNRVTLSESGRTCSIGEYLSPDERVSLAHALEAKLAEARRPRDAA
ncbi:MAG: DUF2244 domain-containing protein [Hyphomicrobiaceae bacterium]